MTEDEAHAWIVAHHGQAAHDRLDRFVGMVAAENQVQNLVSPASVGIVWSRHVVDSAQLLALAPQGWQHWLDIGTGGGFPGMVVALLEPQRSVLMVEPRKTRAHFLERCIGDIGLHHASVAAAKVEAVQAAADVISARAVASVDRLVQAASHCATGSTTWLLPRGRASTDAIDAPMFHVEHSITDEGSIILVARGKPR